MTTTTQDDGATTRHSRDWLHNLVRAYHPTFDTATSPILVSAPMVDQSDLPFRLQVRKYRTHVCFSPMIHSRLLTVCESYRQHFLPTKQTSPMDRPLIIQLCGHDPNTILQAAKMVAPFCDGIDLNCGCPQGIAKRGGYGAFLMEQSDVLLPIVRNLVQNVDVPISVKVRLLPGSTRAESVQRSIVLYQKLVDAGIAMLTVHGRTRHHKGQLTGSANWEAIASVVQEFSNQLPIIANGGISSLEDALSCWKVTGADAVMSSEALLERPSLFDPSVNMNIGRNQLAREYLHLSTLYPNERGGQGSGIKCSRMHIHRMLHADLQLNEDLRQAVSNAVSINDLLEVVDQLDSLHRQRGHFVQTEALSWYVRHREIVCIDGRMVNVSEKKHQRETSVPSREDIFEDADGCFCADLFDEKIEDYN